MLQRNVEILRYAENPYKYKALNLVNSLEKPVFGNYTIAKRLITKKLHVIGHSKIYNTELAEIQPGM